MKKKTKRKSLAYYKRKLWPIFSEYIRRKDADQYGMVKCISCSTIAPWKDLQAGHCLPKSLGLSIYFDERNVKPQCATCNLTLQGNQYQFMRALEAIYGSDISEELNEQRRHIRQIKAWEFEEMIDNYQEKLASLLNRAA